MKLHLPGQYCIDTSALIDLRPYRVEFFPSLWTDLERLKRNARLVAPRQVLEELRRKNDAVWEWANANKDMFAEVTPEQIRLVKDILHNFRNLIDVNSETEEADPFVIALAITDHCTVVTQEGRKNIHSIPNVCDHYGVDCLSLFGFFRQEDLKY